MWKNLGSADRKLRNFALAHIGPSCHSLDRASANRELNSHDGNAQGNVNNDESGGGSDDDEKEENKNKEEEEEAKKPSYSPNYHIHN